MPPSPPPRKRCKRYNTPGHRHYLTCSCFRRQPFLTSDRAPRWLVDAISEARHRHNFRLIAWVFMPEHVHLLIHPLGTPYSISRMLSSIKLPVTIHTRNWGTANAPGFLEKMLDLQPNGKRAFRFWQREGGYDRNSYSADELWEKIHYIHNNPVRRKLVARAAEWEWSSAADYAGLRRGPLPVDNQDLPWTW